ncbi:MAG: hypothetical protein ABIQ72_10200 [Usitatibacter sp.]
MRTRTAIAAFLSLVASSAVFAQTLNCRVLISGTGTAQHNSDIVVAPSALVTLEAHCIGGAATTYVWSTGATTPSINATAPASEGSTQGYTLTVTQNGQQQTVPAIVRAAAAGTPVCTLARDPAGPVPVFTTVRVTANCDSATAYSWTGGYDVRGQGQFSVVHVNVVNDPTGLAVPIDVFGSNANGAGATAGTTMNYTLAAPSCRIVANPAGTIAPLAAVTLTAQCDGAPTSYVWSNGATGASMTVNLASSTGYSVTASNATGAGMRVDHVVGVSGDAPTLLNYTGHWWGGPSEDGWGMTLNQHGEKIFGVIYFYDATGEPTWAVMPAGSFNANKTAYTGELYQPQGAPRSDYDPNQLVVGAPSGTMTLTFTNATTATASYRLGYSQFDPSGRSITTYGQKSISPLIVNSGANPQGVNVADMWWGGALQNGWGISINQRSSQLFNAWFTYGRDRRPAWFIFSGDTWTSNTIAGRLFRVTGAPFLGVPYSPSAKFSTDVGPASYTFSTPADGAFNYSVNGETGAKQIMRQEF